MKNIKCVIWDLDNTLWEGVLLEGDKVALKPGILDILETLDSRGILMSIASKNNYEQAMDQLVRLEIDHYFLYPQIDWNAKSVNVGRIQQKLNIGMDTIAFVDDQEFERDEVKAVHSMITIIDAEQYQDLVTIERMNPKVITEDSRRRRIMYLTEQKRQEDEKNYIGPSSEFMAGLNMVFRIAPAGQNDLIRAEELTVRTNQLNSTGIVYSYEELKGFADSPQHHLWVCELTDKYGTYGKIGLVLVEVQEDAWNIKLLLMSCRVASRGVGTVLLSFLMKSANKEGKLLRAEFKRTDRNRQMLLTYQFANFEDKKRVGDSIIFENDLTIIQDYPPYIKVIVDKNQKLGGLVNASG